MFDGSMVRLRRSDSMVTSCNAVLMQPALAAGNARVDEDEAVGPLLLRVGSEGFNLE